MRSHGRCISWRVEWRQNEWERYEFLRTVDSNEPDSKIVWLAGRLELTNGAVYTGNWKDGKYDGKGLYVWSDGSKYDGDWVSNRAHGSGTFIDTDEQIWIGQFAKGNGEALYNQLS